MATDVDEMNRRTTPRLRKWLFSSVFYMKIEGRRLYKRSDRVAKYHPL
jgi:hypothetical protein